MFGCNCAVPVKSRVVTFVVLADTYNIFSDLLTRLSFLESDSINTHLTLSVPDDSPRVNNHYKKNHKGLSQGFIFKEVKDTVNFGNGHFLRHISLVCIRQM